MDSDLAWPDLWTNSIGSSSPWEALAGSLPTKATNLISAGPFYNLLYSPKSCDILYLINPAPSPPRLDFQKGTWRILVTPRSRQLGTEWKASWPAEGRPINNHTLPVFP